MEFFEVVRNRHSVRRYEIRDVEQEKLDRILEAVNSAPSAGDLQGYEVILVKSSVTKADLARAAHGQSFVAEAPVALVFCADHERSASRYGDRGAEQYAVQDATIAAAYCQLAATALGLATVWVGAFDPEGVAQALQIPYGITPVAIVPIGYPAETPNITPRRPLGELVRSERY